jgi:hypothetical protein
MPPSAKEYRSKALECTELAAKTNDPESRWMLEQTAGQWIALANGIEKYGAKKKQKPCAIPASDIRGLGASGDYARGVRTIDDG